MAGGERQETAEAWLAKQALLELCHAYCVAVDRLDRPLMERLWWPEASVDVGVFAGNALDYAAAITAPNDALRRSFHLVANALFAVEGDEARGQVYVLASSTMVEEGEEVETLVGGRYLDRFARRRGEWRFLHRAFCLDFAWQFSPAAVRAPGLAAIFPQRGRRDCADPWYALWGGES